MPIIYTIKRHPDFHFHTVYILLSLSDSATMPEESKPNMSMVELKETASAFGKDARQVSLIEFGAIVAGRQVHHA